MRADELIEKRFFELTEKANAVKETYHEPVGRRPSEIFYHLNTAKAKEWPTGVLSLLQRVFGENSIYYQDLRVHYDFRFGTDIYSTDFEDWIGIFLAAKEEYEGGYLFKVQTLAKV
jgi:hypothetical protein